jgi:hypothetical protein
MEERRTEMEDSVAEVQETTEPRGNGLQEFQLHKLLMDLNSSSKTGTLTVKMPVFMKRIYLDKRKVVFPSSTLKDDRFQMTETQKSQPKNNGKMWDLENILFE